MGTFLAVAGLVVGIIGAGVGWYGVTARAAQRQRDALARTVTVVVAGTTSVGKSQLFHAWKGDVLHVAKPTVVLQAETVQSFQFGGLEIRPTFVDMAGSRPESVQQALDRVRYGTKSVLIFVVAPTRADSGGVDRDLISEQRGFAGVIRAAVVNTHRRPDEIVIFINKADQMVTTDPNTRVQSDSRAKIEETFQHPIEQLRVVANEYRIGFAVVVGSAYERWGLDGIRRAVERAANR